MKNLAVIFFLISLSGAAYGQSSQTKQQQEVQKVLIDLFETFSNYDPIIFKQLLTPDVLVLESGVVWNMDTLVSKLGGKRPEDYKRINSLKFIKTEISGSMAFVTYYNHAEVHGNGNDRVVDWLESAVLIKMEKMWKVKMLHSTKLANK